DLLVQVGAGGVLVDAAHGDNNVVVLVGLVVVLLEQLEGFQQGQAGSHGVILLVSAVGGEVRGWRGIALPDSFFQLGSPHQSPHPAPAPASPEGWWWGRPAPRRAGAGTGGPAGRWLSTGTGLRRCRSPRR